MGFRSLLLTRFYLIYATCFSDLFLCFYPAGFYCSHVAPIIAFTPFTRLLLTTLLFIRCGVNLVFWESTAFSPRDLRHHPLVPHFSVNALEDPSLQLAALARYAHLAP